MFRLKLLEFVEELMRLFETKNKTLYHQLIIVRHKLKNVYDSAELKSLVEPWMADAETMSKVRNKEWKVFTPLNKQINVEWLWSELTPENKALVWKWIDVLAGNF